MKTNKNKIMKINSNWYLLIFYSHSKINQEIFLIIKILENMFFLKSSLNL